MGLLRATSHVVILLLGFHACRFVVPDVPEQKQLVTERVFASGTPPWIANTVEPADRRSSGLIPQSYSAPPIAAAATQEFVASDPRSLATKQAQKRAAAETMVDSSSPLHRINTLCPGVESQVTDALTTVDRSRRIAKYETLTKTCSSSADLWLWLGNDYLKEGSFAAARKAYEQVLVLDARREEARVGVAEATRGLAVHGETKQ